MAIQRAGSRAAPRAVFKLVPAAAWCGGGAAGARMFRASSRAGGAERVRHGKFRSKNRCVTDYCNSCFCETESLIFCFLYTERVPHVPSRNFARRRGGVGAAAARRPTADPAATPVKDLVAGKWRRNRLKRLNQGREMVGSRKPRSHNIWCTATRLTVRSDRELRECQS